MLQHKVSNLMGKIKQLMDEKGSANVCEDLKREKEQRRKLEEEIVQECKQRNCNLAEATQVPSSSPDSLEVLTSSSRFFILLLCCEVVRKGTEVHCKVMEEFVAKFK